MIDELLGGQTSTIPSRIVETQNWCSPNPRLTATNFGIGHNSVKQFVLLHFHLRPANGIHYLQKIYKRIPHAGGGSDCLLMRIVIDSVAISARFTYMFRVADFAACDGRAFKHSCIVLKLPIIIMNINAEAILLADLCTGDQGASA